MNILLKILKYVLIVAFIFLCLLYYFFDDIKKYAVKTVITTLSKNEKYLAEPYSISVKDGIVVVKNLNINAENTTIKIAETDIWIPFLFLFNNAIEISLPQFEAKINASGDNNILIVGGVNLKCWKSGKANIKLSSTDLSFDNRKILNFSGDYDEVSHQNFIDINNYLDPSSKGRVAFYINDFSNILVDSLNIPYGGGMISAETFSIDLAKPKLKTLSLTVDNIKIASLIKVSDFKIDGKISGKLTLDPTKMKILSLNLATESRGTLSYKSPKLMDFLGSKHLSFLEKALNSFEYNTIRIESVSSEGTKDNIKISLYGADQKLYDERPINLNINLDLDLKSIIQSYIVVK